MPMVNWYFRMIDVKGEFIMGQFYNNEILYLEFPKVFKTFYPSNVVLFLLHTIYGLKQTSIMYCIATPEALYKMNF